MKINNTIKSLVITVLFLAVSVVAGAQTTRTGYFLKGNAYRYRLNPALMNDQHYFAFPLLGEIDVKTTGNLGLSNFIFDSPDGTSLLTFMHPSVSADDFLADIKDYNKLAVDLDVTLMSFGFFGPQHILPPHPNDLCRNNRRMTVMREPRMLSSRLEGLYHSPTRYLCPLLLPLSA